MIASSHWLKEPAIVDRLIQQCVLQVLQPRIDPSFSQHSYGFRPGKRAHDAVRAAQRFIQEGRRWVVDVDLEKFFDRVNHDVLMGKLAKRIADRRMLGLIRRYLEAGIMASGVVMERQDGTPQGGPLSPVLANVLLAEVDKELEQRGHAFARYADDCNVYVRSKRAGERVMDTLRRIYGHLKLRINETKSAVARPWDRKFLGYSFWFAKGGEVKRRVASKALVTMKDRVRDITKRNGEAQAAAARKKLDERARNEAETGKKAGGRPHQVPDVEQAKPDPKAQRHFTDPESRIMPDGANKGSFIQGYNAQIAVDAYAQVIVAADITQQANDKLQLEPMMASMAKNMGPMPLNQFLSVPLWHRQQHGARIQRRYRARSPTQSWVHRGKARRRALAIFDPKKT